ncbi:Hypothetical protein AA314_05082 [Archangium gephyra]|uniref:Peptidase metallopeptidase domain-containing protein n=1 Tax=Archangium gephyra TaxID=48 RepID=A0AAC8QAC3_9BACT|nr:Hypothetical protein AA314_05082 [Archangium gephyra]
MPVGQAERMALVKDCRWTDDSLSIRFLDGDPGLQERVKKVARIWTEFANIKFLFGNDPEAQIRISFKERGSWSYVGTQCLGIAKHAPTMNFGWLTPATGDEEVMRVVLHEFGHALGCIHEHQNPAGGIQWNKEAVYAYYSGHPNYWSRKDVDTNLFQLYDKDLTAHTQLDPHSIMLYPVPAAFTLDGKAIGGSNKVLSDMDKEFIGKLYP